MKHLLVTNDFPPKVGGIQSYLWELWRRLPPTDATVLTTPHGDAAAFDASSPLRIERTREPVLLPTPSLTRRIDALSAEVGAELVVLDPALPLGHLGPRLALPYGLIVHGAEISAPGRVPGLRRSLARVLRGAEVVVAGGEWTADRAEGAARCGLPLVVVPPGVDLDRFGPADEAQRRRVRHRLGVSADATLVVSLSRLVPRKGMDTLVAAAARLAPAHPELEVVIGGTGRDRRRLERLVADAGAPVRLVGRVDHHDLPGFYGAADIFAMDCRRRWWGLEQEGFGIVFVEAAACGVPQVAGDSGGAAEAVADGVTGLVVDDASSVQALAEALGTLVLDADLRAAMGAASRRRVEAHFSYDLLSERLRTGLAQTSQR